MHFKTIVKTYGNGPPADPPPNIWKFPYVRLFFFVSFPKLFDLYMILTVRFIPKISPFKAEPRNTTTSDDSTAKMR